MSNTQINYATIQVAKLTPTIGAEIGGVDLRGPVTDKQLREIREALLENLVIFFRDQHLTIEQHKAFARFFGPLHIHPTLGTKEHPEIIEIKADENSKQVAGEFWHSDVTSDPEPPMGSILYLKVVPENGGDTLFANMYRAYETLSAPIRRMVDQLRAVHDGSVYEGAFYDTEEGRPAKKYATSEHPVARTHPETGRKALFVNRYFTTRIVGLAPSESSAILEMLFQHCERDDFKCRFKWRQNSVAFWDNRCTQHQAIFDYYPQRRYGHRVTIAGDKPV